MNCSFIYAVRVLRFQNPPYKFSLSICSEFAVSINFKHNEICKWIETEWRERKKKKKKKRENDNARARVILTIVYLFIVVVSPAGVLNQVNFVFFCLMFFYFSRTHTLLVLCFVWRETQGRLDFLFIFIFVNILSSPSFTPARMLSVLFLCDDHIDYIFIGCISRINHFNEDLLYTRHRVYRVRARTRTAQSLTRIQV